MSSHWDRPWDSQGHDDWERSADFEESLAADEQPGSGGDSIVPCKKCLVSRICG